MNLSAKPFAESCEENKLPILTVLMPLLASADRVLEIGSGTGQHAVFFAARMPHLIWQPSDRAEALPGIRLWLEEAGLANCLPPLVLDVTRDPWPIGPFDAVFSANTAHIMHWPAVCAMFRGVGGLLGHGGRFALYGPFSYAGEHTSSSNARFDRWLRDRDPLSGVRDREAMDDLARAEGLRLDADFAMPVNNRTLVWGRP